MKRLMNCSGNRLKIVWTSIFKGYLEHIGVQHAVAWCKRAENVLYFDLRTSEGCRRHKLRLGKGQLLRSRRRVRLRQILGRSIDRVSTRKLSSAYLMLGWVRQMPCPFYRLHKNEVVSQMMDKHLRSNDSFTFGCSYWIRANVFVERWTTRNLIGCPSISS